MTPTKKEIEEYMRLHNEDEVGINNQWTYEEAEYFLLLDDKYDVKYCDCYTKNGTGLCDEHETVINEAFSIEKIELNECDDDFLTIRCVGEDNLIEMINHIKKYNGIIH